MNSGFPVVMRWHFGFRYFVVTMRILLLLFLRPANWVICDGNCHILKLRATCLQQKPPKINDPDKLWQECQLFFQRSCKLWSIKGMCLGILSQTFSTRRLVSEEHDLLTRPWMILSVLYGGATENISIWNLHFSYMNIPGPLTERTCQGLWVIQKKYFKMLAQLFILFMPQTEYHEFLPHQL